MKRKSFISFFLLSVLIFSLPIFFVSVYKAHNIRQQAAISIGQYEKFELSFPYSGNYSNPYDPSVVDIEGVFTSPSGKIFKIPGFYFQDFTRSGDTHKEILTKVPNSDSWKVRFSPSEEGNYTYIVTLKDSSGTQTLGSGTFAIVASNNPGFIRTVGYHLQFDNGQLFIPLGLNAPWFQDNTSANKWGDGTYGVDAMYSMYNASGANTFHLWTCSWNDGNPNSFAKPDIACNGSATTAMQMSQPDSWEMDYIINQAHLKNIYVIPILKHKDQSNFDAGDLIYIRYAIARWGYSANLAAWDTFKEGAYKVSPVTSYLTALQQMDPYHHPISASEGNHASVNNTGAFDGVQSLPSLTLVQNHDYSNDCNQPYDNDTGLYALHVVISTNIRKFNKPSFFGESGMHTCGPDGNSDINGTVSQYVSQDRDGRILRGQIWGEFLSSAGGISVWNQMNTANVSVFKGLSSFIKLLPSASAFDQTVPFSSYDTKTEVTTSDQKLQVIGRKSPSFALIRVYNTTGTWAAILRDHQTPLPTSGIITFTNMLNGKPFTIIWVDTVTGAVIATQTVSANAGNLILTLPQPVTEDVAALISTGTVPSVTPTSTPSITTTPTQGITPTNNPSSTATPTLFQTTVSPTETLTPTQFGESPTNTPSSTPIPGHTIGTVSVHFEGIDKQNNAAPNHQQRALTIYFYKSQNFNANADYVLNTFVSFNSSDPTGVFINTAINLSSIPQGNYYILAKSPEGSLREQLATQQVTISPGQTVSLNGSTTNTTNFRMGDLDGDNQVTLSDYNILVDCFGSKTTSSACEQHAASDKTKGLFSDINDDTVVDGIDYNILIRNIGQSGY